MPLRAQRIIWPLRSQFLPLNRGASPLAGHLMCRTVGTRCLVTSKGIEAQSSMSRKFEELKRSFLSKPDKSSAGCIDPPILSLCTAVNECPSVFTTSSCSGRALLWLGKDPPKKRKDSPGLVKVFVTHDPGDIPQLLDRAVDSVSSQEQSTSMGDAEALWLRFEPFILHACCRDWNSAQSFVVAAREAGFKNTAVSGPGPTLQRASGCRTWRVAIDGSERLEMPLLVAGALCFRLDCPQLRAWLEDTLRRKFARNAARTARFLDAIMQSDVLKSDDASAGKA